MAPNIETFCDKAAAASFEASSTRTELAAKLGLSKQADFVDPRQEAATQIYGELKGEELATWRKYLPRRYSKNSHGGCGCWDWRSYDSSLVPLECLESIVQAEGLGVFHDIQIWAPHRGADDVFVVGVIYGDISRSHKDARYFPIARWGAGTSWAAARERNKATSRKDTRNMALGIVASLVAIALFVWFLTSVVMSPMPKP